LLVICLLHSSRPRGCLYHVHRLAHCFLRSRLSHFSPTPWYASGRAGGLFSSPSPLDSQGCVPEHRCIVFIFSSTVLWGLQPSIVSPGIRPQPPPYSFPWVSLLDWLCFPEILRARIPSLGVASPQSSARALVATPTAFGTCRLFACCIHHVHGAAFITSIG